MSQNYNSVQTCRGEVMKYIWQWIITLAVVNPWRCCGTDLYFCNGTLRLQPWRLQYSAVTPLFGLLLNSNSLSYEYESPPHVVNKSRHMRGLRVPKAIYTYTTPSCVWATAAHSNDNMVLIRGLFTEQPLQLLSSDSLTNVLEVTNTSARFTTPVPDTEPRLWA